MSTDSPQSPPGRKVVVVREGPSKRRPVIIDAAVGLLGLMLILGSVALVDILPEEPVIVPQYKAAFTGNYDDRDRITFADTGERRVAKAEFAQEGETMVWRLEFPDINIYQVTASLRFPENHPATLRDSFFIELESPNGTIYPYNAAGGLMFTNSVERIPVNATNPPLSPVFFRPVDASPTSIAFPVGTVPTPYFFATEDILGEPGHFELFEIEAALEALHYIPDTQGVWTVRATLVDAGDCPVANPATLTVDHAAQCQMQTTWEKQQATGTPPTDPNEWTTDNNNEGILTDVSYLYFQVKAEEA